MFYLLEEYESELLWSGDIFRVFIRDKSENYYIDQVVDFIIFETMDTERSLGLLSISGYKAGKIEFIFPKEAFKKYSIYSLDKKWVEKNIYDYLYINKECDKVFVSKNDSILPF